MYSIQAITFQTMDNYLYENSDFSSLRLLTQTAAIWENERRPKKVLAHIWSSHLIRTKSKTLVWKGILQIRFLYHKITYHQPISRFQWKWPSICNPKIWLTPATDYITLPNNLINEKQYWFNSSNQRLGHVAKIERRCPSNLRLINCIGSFFGTKRLY